MRTKNAAPIQPAERSHLARVKESGGAVCGTGGPVDAHHIVQGLHFCTVGLCRDCHMGSENGIHGRKTMWRIHKLDELGALNETLRRLSA